MNRSEEFTYKLCKHSFLSLWSFATPHKKDGKELCDVLVVLDPYLIIFSVKEIQFSDEALEPTASRRWRRKAVDESVKQIYNAQRWIAKGITAFANRDKPISIPDLKNLRIHRVAVALGSKGKVDIESRDFGRGFVHVYDEASLYLVLRELDTITDFVDYLRAVESLLSRDNRHIVLQGGHKDLMAMYLVNNRSFTEEFNLLIVGDDLWEGFEDRPEVKRRRKEDMTSYLWDSLIEKLSIHAREGTWEYASNPGEAELVLRTMAKENRFSRRFLSQQIDDILRTTPKGRRVRLLQSPSGTVYVILVSEKGRDRDERRAELGSRCFVARDMVPTSKTVVGIATENYDPTDPGFSFDVCYTYFGDWTPEQHKEAQEIRLKYGWFPEDRQRHVQVDEYPPEDK